MIVLDIECSGLYPEKHGIWQIAAMEIENPKNYFIQECNIDEEDEIFPQALDVIGKTEEELRCKKKQTQKQMINNFLKWCSQIKNKNFICQNPFFDLGFINLKSRKYGLENILPIRSFDLHTIASLKYFEVNKEFLISEKNQSNMSLTEVMTFCGLIDNRRIVDIKTRKVIREGVMHNALHDVKITAECFSRIVYGKNLIEDFKDVLIPEYLRK
jgi:DNA polymerase III epsilon subunit-like protein